MQPASPCGQEDANFLDAGCARRARNAGTERSEGVIVINELVHTIELLRPEDQ